MSGLLPPILPRSMRAQLVLVILAALALAQGLSLWLFADERNLAVQAALGREAAGRAANVAGLLADAPVGLRPSILRAADSPLVRFSLGPDPVVDHLSHEDRAIANVIAGQIGADPSPEIRVELHDGATRMPPMPGMSGAMAQMHRAMQDFPVNSVEMRISIALPSGEWLNVATRFHRPPLQWAWREAATFAVSALLLAAALWLAVGRLTGPIRRLAQAADRFGRGEAVDTLPPTGPDELRRLTTAFNQMQTRITRFVEDRTRMLAALGHDLRSPLTALRVRAELVDDDETRDRLVITIEEMQKMTEATLAFARGMSSGEPSETVSIRDFLAVLVGDAAEAGEDVFFEAPALDMQVRLRPTAMRRALRNLIENAARYGGRAIVSLGIGKDVVHITVEDEGPGIPEADMERVFDPFVRLETSRSRDTGGTGLGLSIARTIVQSHGGDITLANRPGGGLCVSITLPVAGMLN